MFLSLPANPGAAMLQTVWSIDHHTTPTTAVVTVRGVAVAAIIASSAEPEPQPYGRAAPTPATSASVATNSVAATSVAATSAETATSTEAASASSSASTTSSRRCAGSQRRRPSHKHGDDEQYFAIHRFLLGAPLRVKSLQLQIVPAA